MGADKPLQLWTASELRDELKRILAKVPPGEFKKIQPTLERVQESCNTDLQAAKKRLAEFRVSGPFGDQNLGVLAEVFSRPLRLAVLVAEQKLALADQALRRVRRGKK